MGIENIFNAVDKKHENNTTVDSQEFKIEYWKNSRDSYDPPKESKTDFSKMYYNALVPTKEDSIISKYDDEKLNRLVTTLGDDLLLISGDFWGIQKFIFDGVTTSKASKILRSRSAMVQLITYAVVDRIKKAFDGSEALLFGAGKFMVLAKNENRDRIKEIQQELDSYFLKNFFGQNGFILSTSTTKGTKLKNQKDMEEDLLALGADNDNKKLNKFDLLNVEDDAILIDPFKDSKIDDNNSCKFCNKRIVDKTLEEDSCAICFNQINLGKKLTTHNYMNIIQFGKQSHKKKIDKNMVEILKLGNQSYYARFSNSKTHFSWGNTFDISINSYDGKIQKWSLNSHVSKNKNKNKEIITFSEYLKKDNREDGKVISSGLMALKADIDKLGDTFRELYKEDFKKFNRLSREVEFFFSDYITSLVAEKENVYTVFAGGDDLFLIGEYREIIKLAKEIRDEFYKFSLEKTTISMGLVMFKPSTPITFVSKMADDAEKRAKAVTVDGKDRNGIDIFGVSMKYDEFIKIEKDFDKVVKYLKDNKLETKAFYYRLIELCDMYINIHNDVRNAMWKSKLNYMFKRNVYYRIDKNNTKLREESLKMLQCLNILIEENSEKFKPSLFLQIYKNRDEQKEKEND